MGNLCFPEFNTTLLVIDGDTMRVTVSSTHFYVPRKNGFWELGTTLPGTLAGTRAQTKQQDAEDDSSAQFVWQLLAAPLGTKPALSLPPPPKDPTGPEQPEEPSDDSDELKSLQLTWAGTDYLSVDEQMPKPHRVGSPSMSNANTPTTTQQALIRRQRAPMHNRRRGESYRGRSSCAHNLSQGLSDKHRKRRRSILAIGQDHSHGLHHAAHCGQ
jgi:hypothetical protein